MVRKGVSLSLRGITSTVHFTRTVEELLFKGYPDTLMKLAKTFPFFVNVDIPQWDRFGWLYMVNSKINLKKFPHFFPIRFLCTEKRLHRFRWCVQHKNRNRFGIWKT
jgi:hypothetical protein